ncbi:MFS general substrate transporter, partial [Sporormia fimetaria CBS 119925]
KGDKVSWKTLPHKKQLLLISLCRLSTPLTNACLLPYLYYLVKSIISDPSHPSAPQRISRLTGLLAAAYPIGQITTSMLWGRASDTYGRKPAIILGLLISVIANLSFGFSRSIGMLFFWRVVAGMANGIVGVMRTMTAETVKDRKHQTRAFLAPPLVFNSGRVAALAVGGCLADPVRNLPGLFGPDGVFNVGRNPEGVEWTLRNPYALPAVFNGAVLGFCAILAALWLKETLSSKGNDTDVGLVIGNWISASLKTVFQRKRDQGYIPLQLEDSNDPISPNPIRPSSSSGTSTPVQQPHPPRPHFLSIWTPHLLKTLLTFSLLPLHNSTFLHLFPLFLSMPISPHPPNTPIYFTGGLGLSPPTIGLYLATFSIFGILLQLLLYPHLQTRLGTLGVLRLANLIFPLVYISIPYLSLFSTSTLAKWPAMAAVLFAQVVARTMAIPSTVLLLTDAAPSRNVLGTVHGAGNTVSA